MKEYSLLMRIVDDEKISSPIECSIILGDVGVVIGDEMLSALREAFDAGLTVHLRAESKE